jgi:hypothetical protein
MMTPDHLERQHTLTTATARYEDLRLQDSLADPEDGPLPSLPDSLELLALGELIARKAAYGRQLAIRSARRAGASWTQIGAALGTSKQSAWEAHNRWIEEQARRHGAVGELGFDAVETRAARELAGGPDAGEGG